ncbi:uncharacterized protein [Gossypium hirsutum]|uniref:Uncharacterized protein isoform X5 n=1 Tax=Gossypium hirsutum TaxID=3635 RepID=A0A1U8KQ24_GOSHI|nr:uncharacterized protein LOC107918100 isoform X5 [Gossypium hirsutum]
MAQTKMQHSFSLLCNNTQYIGLMLLPSISKDHYVNAGPKGFAKSLEHQLSQRPGTFGTQTSSSIRMSCLFPTLQHNPNSKRPFAAHMLFQILLTCALRLSGL